MKRIAFVIVLIVTSSARAADEDGWVTLFNGADLSNWVNVNCAPETWTAEDGVLKCTGKPTGALRTPTMYENFVLELEWRHLNRGGNAGVFVWGSAIAAPGVPFLRAIEVQVLDNAFDIPGKNQWYTTHGDVFPIHGATMKPIHKGSGMRCFPLEERSKLSPEWNHYRITGQDGNLRLSVNGKEVSGGNDCNWRKGYLALESEGAPTEWRNIRVKALPPSGATPELSAPEEVGWQSLYNGVDLRGWKAEGDSKNPWSANDWRLTCPAGGGALFTETNVGDFELIVDVQTPKNAKDRASSAEIIFPTGDGAHSFHLSGKPGEWSRSLVTVRSGRVIVKSNTGGLQELKLRDGSPKLRRIGLAGSPTGTTLFANIYLRQLK